MISADMLDVKIIDFGMSREGVDKLGSTTQNSVVAYRWCAPEVLSFLHIKTCLIIYATDLYREL